MQAFILVSTISWFFALWDEVDWWERIITSKKHMVIKKDEGWRDGSLTPMTPNMPSSPSHFAFSHSVGSTTGLEFPSKPKLPKKNESDSNYPTKNIKYYPIMESAEVPPFMHKINDPPPWHPLIIPWSNYTPRKKKTWHWKIPTFNRKYIFKWWIFQCHVSFHGGNHSKHFLVN